MKKEKKKLIKVIIIIVAKGSCLFLINTIILQILKISVMIVVVFGFSFVHQIKKNTEQNNTAYVTWPFWRTVHSRTIVGQQDK